ncbi:MAG: CDP-alcohol phosphatidyltransferase family protein [Bacillaceae bacterium]|nr:CDP-alcohol phosphatidyltransferase family protein [Bacillaceae bacterium]
MNWPNALTFARFLLIPLFIYIYFSPHPYHNELAFLVLLSAGLTDVIDGYLARKNNQVTQLGIMLDPLADKLMMLTVVLSFLISGRIDLWAALIFFFRDAAMIVSSFIFHLQGKKTVPANFFGKLTTVLFYIAFLFVMFDLAYSSEIMWGVILFSFITSVIYLFKFRLINY